MPGTALLTGATGFIGSRLAARLRGRGYRLRCVVRSDANARMVRERFGAEAIVCDLSDAVALAHAMHGCSVVYHLAAIYDVGIIDEQALERTNVEGTRAFLRACAEAAVPRAIYVSTTVALEPSDGGGPTSIVEARGPYPSAYHRTKAEAHRLAREAQQRGLPLIVACPAFVYGPGDNGPGGRFVSDLLRGRVPALLSDPASFSYVHVDDVAEALELLADRGTAGRTYILSGQPETMNGFARRVTQLGGVRMPILRFPSALAKATGVALDVIARASGLRFAITREGVATTARSQWLHSNEETRRELGWQPRSLEEGLPETVAWFQARR